MPDNEEKKEEFELHQFMRNKYFCGKLMTVTDFVLEQEYFNRKRYLLNRLIYGKGLLCGFRHLKVRTRDSNEEVCIKFEDGGVAFDSRGQEIVVPRNMKKIVLDKYDHPFKKNDFGYITYLYLKYSPRYSSLSDSEREMITSNSQGSEEVHCPRILEDFEVIASVDHPKEEKNESEMISCDAHAEADEKVFFAAVGRNSSVGELLICEKESYRWQHYLKVRHKGHVNNNSASGVVHFKDFNMNTITSHLIDPKLGEGPIFVQLGQETEEGNKIMIGEDGDSWEKGFTKLHLGAIIEPHSGKFRVKVVFDDESERKSIRVRWWAYKVDKIYDMEKFEEDVENNVTLKKFNFVSDPKVGAKFAENGLCESGVKNCMTDGNIRGGDHYARIEKGLSLIKKDGIDIETYVALNGNPKKLAKLMIEQKHGERYTLDKKNNWKWEISDDWVVKVEHFNSELQPPTTIKITLFFEEEELKSFEVKQGDLITYCDDIEDETEVPIFVTYIDNISFLNNNGVFSYETAKVTLEYTWLISNRIEPN